jgi:hypothetical protein
MSGRTDSFGAEGRSAARALGERNAVCRTEGVLRGFLIGELVVCDENACDDCDAADDQSVLAL